MRKIEEFSGTQGLDSDLFLHAAVDLNCAASEIHALIYEKNSSDVSWEDSVKTLIKHPLLAVGLHLLAMIETFGYEYLESQNTTHLLLQEAIKKLDFLATTKPDGEV